MFTSSLLSSPSMLLAALALFSSQASVIAAPVCGLVPPKTAGLSAQVSSGTNGTGAGTASGDVVATGWYPGWLGSELAPANISWSKYSALTFAFA